MALSMNLIHHPEKASSFHRLPRLGWRQRLGNRLLMKGQESCKDHPAEGRQMFSGAPGRLVKTQVPDPPQSLWFSMSGFSGSQGMLTLLLPEPHLENHWRGVREKMREGTEVPPRMGAASRTGASLQGQVGGAPSEGTARRCRRRWFREGRSVQPRVTRVPKDTTCNATVHDEGFSLNSRGDGTARHTQGVGCRVWIRTHICHK